MVQIQTLEPPSDKISHKEEKVEVVVGERTLGKGTLYISEEKVYWIVDDTDAVSKGFYLEYPQISLHAVCKDRSVHSQDHLYLLVDDPNKDRAEVNGKGDVMNGMDEENGGEDSEESDGSDTTIKLIPDKSDALSAIYESMCSCQSLHPDPETLDDSDEENEEENELDAPAAEANDNEEVKFDADGQLIVYESAENDNNGAQVEPDAMEVEHGQFEDAEK